MQVNFSFLALPELTGTLRVKIFETTALNTPVVTVDYPSPSFPLTESITVPHAVPVVVEFYNSPDGVADGSLITDFTCNPEYTSAEIRAPKMYLVDAADSPVSGQTSFSDADLDGWTFSLERRGVGTLMQGTEWDTVDGGGFKLLLTDDTFGANETFTVHFLPKIVTKTPAETSTGVISDIVTLTADTQLDNSHYNKMLSCASVTFRMTHTLPAIADTPAQTLFAFNTNMGQQYNTTIQVSGTDSIFWNKEERSAVYLGRNEQLTIVKGADGWYIWDFRPSVIVGSQFWADTVLVNTLERNGALLNRLDYPRLFNEYISNLPLSMITDEATWATDATTNRGKFTMGDGSTTFRIPDSRGTFVRAFDNGRGLDNGRVIGTYQADGIKSWSMNVTIPKTATSRSDAGVGRFASGADENEPNDMTPFTITYNGTADTRPMNETKIPLIAI